MSHAPTDPHFHEVSERFLANRERTAWHDQSLWFVRTKRDRQAHQTPDWEELRSHAAAIKAHVVDHLPELTYQFAAQARSRGWTVHFAADAGELNRTVHGILERHAVKRIVKSKSMLTEECGLNPYLMARGMEVVDTDLGERIVQLRDEPPSHIVLPAIHIKRGEVGELFHRTMGSPAGETDPVALTGYARTDLRKRFLEADAGITGVNFAVAETGSIVICTNEGNADLGTALQPVHVACMGVEKLVPLLSDVAVFLRLLARSATGQPITTYSTHLSGPDPLRPGHEAHLVILDNGRSGIERDAEHRRTLSCIRCGACLNTCPIYRRSGGFAYGWTIPGPIGAVLAPSMIGTKKAKELPFASTLCGSCTNVCPVKIDLHEQLLSWRARIAADGHVAWHKRMAMHIGSLVMSHPGLYAAGGWMVRKLWPQLIAFPVGPLKPWTDTRDLPPAPRQSFRGWWKEEGRDHG